MNNTRRIDSRVREIAAPVVILAIAVVFLLTACGGDPGSTSERSEWRLTGPLLAKDGDIWIIDAVPVVVPSSAMSEGSVSLGTIVEARGIFKTSGRRIAQSITILTNGQVAATLPEATITGPVERVADDIWAVDGIDVIVPDGARVYSLEGGSDPGDLIGGSIAEVRGYRTPDGRVVAVEVGLRPAVVLDTAAATQPLAPTATSTPTPASAATSSSSLSDPALLPSPTPAPPPPAPPAPDSDPPVPAPDPGGDSGPPVHSQGEPPGGEQQPNDDHRGGDRDAEKDREKEEEDREEDRKKAEEDREEERKKKEEDAQKEREKEEEDREKDGEGQGKGDDDDDKDDNDD